MPPARPRDAASLVILRRDPEGSRVLLGRRPPRDRFMPDVWVFPGGRVDRGDETAPVHSELQPRVAAELVRSGAGSRVRGLGVAALRETWEETGLAFGDVHGGRLHPRLSSLDFVARAITPRQNPIRYHARFFTADAGDATGELAGSGELLDLQWFSVDDALALPIIDVTEAVLREVLRRDARRDGERAPLIHYRLGRMHVTRG